GARSPASTPASVTTISGVLSRWAWARPRTSPDGSSRPAIAAPGPSPISPLTAASTTAAMASGASTTVSERRWAAARSATAAPGATKTRAAPARLSPSTSTSATVVRAINRGGGARRARTSPSSARPGLEQRPHALQRLGEVGLGVGVGDAQVALAVDAERRARQHRDPGLLQQPIGHLGGGAAGAGDVGEHVERAARALAGDTGQAVEAVHEQVAPSLELGHHARHRRVIPLRS